MGGEEREGPRIRPPLSGRPSASRRLPRGEEAERRFISFCMSGNRVLAGMNVNVWDVVDSIRALVLSGADVDEARLCDPGVPPDTLVT
ncbi:oxidoreductase C-terminal domain-containing protein [Streptomyces sp. NPDC047706]|uniref:oxidoreductase C-terminal domain-containing protein n=1 Tax=Streptomyces sp. NPDC047706 TaxID=3365486 RepID=UPI00371F4919